MFKTVTLQVAVFPLPSKAAAVITAFPFFSAVTLPSELTVAISGLELLHSISLLLALFGETYASIVFSSPAFRFKTVGDRDI